MSNCGCDDPLASLSVRRNVLAGKHFMSIRLVALREERYLLVGRVCRIQSTDSLVPPCKRVRGTLHSWAMDLVFRGRIPLIVNSLALDRQPRATFNHFSTLDYLKATRLMPILGKRINQPNCLSQLYVTTIQFTQVCRWWTGQARHIRLA